MAGGIQIVMLLSVVLSLWTVIPLCSMTEHPIAAFRSVIGEVPAG